MIRPLPVLALYLIAGVTVLAQQLEPRAYSASPVGINIGILAYGYSAGDLNFDPSLPIDNASAKISNAAIGYFRSINVAGRSANVSVAMPAVISAAAPRFGVATSWPGTRGSLIQPTTSASSPIEGWPEKSTANWP